MTDHSPDSRVGRYAIPQAIIAGGVAMFLVIFGSRWLNLALSLRKTQDGRVALMIGTFLLVATLTVFWRVLRRAKDPSLYRAKGRAWTLTEDPRDAMRALVAGVTLGVGILGVLWIIVGRNSAP